MPITCTARNSPAASAGPAPAQHVTTVPSSGGGLHRTVAQNPCCPEGKVVRQDRELRDKWALKDKTHSTEVGGRSYLDGGRLSAFPSLLLHERVKKKSSELGQLAKETVMPGATKTPESESAPRCGFRPVVTRQAQTICRWCGTAASESRKAQLPAPRFQAPGSGREKWAGEGDGSCGERRHRLHNAAIYRTGPGMRSPAWPVHFCAERVCPAQ